MKPTKNIHAASFFYKKDKFIFFFLLSLLSFWQAQIITSFTIKLI